MRMQVAQVLLPGLLVIASDQGFAAGVRRKALSIAHSLAHSLSSKQTPTDKDTWRGLATLLEAWMAPICAILQEPISGQVWAASLHQPPAHYPILSEMLYAQSSDTLLEA